MTREIFPNASEGPAAAVTAPLAQAVEQALPQPVKDALAGALPDWDLLPAAPFVRRVK